MTARPLRWAALSVLLLATGPALLSGQDPDSLRLDTLVVPIPGDSIATDSVQVADSAQIADSLEIRALPVVPGQAPARPGAAVWRWDRDELLGEPAFTLLELLERIPGLVPIRLGDYGAPEGVSGPGITGGRVRIFLDGFEAVALDGSIPDLSRVSLGALSELRVERAAGEIRIHLVALRPDDARPLSMVEAGTGDLSTNIFRGTFLHPRALGGSLGLSIERLDTQGSRADDAGARQGIWLRYALHRGENAGLAFELRRGTAESLLDTVPPSTTRTDWTVRARARLAEGVVAELFTGASSVVSEEDELTPLDESRRQHGLRVGAERGFLWGSASARILSGPDLPSFRADLTLGGTLDELGGAAVDWGHDRWDGRGVSTRGVRAWTEPFFGLSGFVGWESGVRGARAFAPRIAIPEPPDDDGAEPDPDPDPEPEPEPEPEDPGPTHRFSDATTFRVGGRVALGRLDLSAAWLRSETDSLLPLGLLFDRRGVVVPGDQATGFEVQGSLHVWKGFSLVGSLLQWDAESVYRPERSYKGGIAFHDVFYPTGSLEVWGGLQIQGRDPMLLPLLADEGEDAPLVRVPFYQSWNAHIQVRVQTVRIFVRLENAFVRRANQDFPDRIFPATRSMYGVRWTLWN